MDQLQNLIEEHIGEHITEQNRVDKNRKSGYKMATIYFCESSRLFKGRSAILARRSVQAFASSFG
jgi:hypothetical protein